MNESSTPKTEAAPQPGRMVRNVTLSIFTVACSAVLYMGMQLLRMMPEAITVNNAPLTETVADWSSLSSGLVAGRPGLRLSADMVPVRDWVSSHYGVPPAKLEPILIQAEQSAQEHGFDPLLIVAMVAVESGFNPQAKSSMGAQGLMQVIPRFHMDKIGLHGDANVLFDPKINVKVGTQVLAEGLQRYGSLKDALQYYGGARKDPKARYSKKVLRMKQRLATIVERERQQDA